jgi:hypothetical protein
MCRQHLKIDACQYLHLNGVEAAVFAELAPKTAAVHMGEAETAYRLPADAHEAAVVGPLSGCAHFFRMPGARFQIAKFAEP